MSSLVLLWEEGRTEGGGCPRFIHKRQSSPSLLERRCLRLSQFAAPPSLVTYRKCSRRVARVLFRSFFRFIHKRLP